MDVVLARHIATVRRELEGMRRSLSRLGEEVQKVDAAVVLDGDLTEAQALEPLLIAVNSAGAAVRASRAAEQAARAQIERASVLDEAIKAGEYRREALKVVKENLTNAKFLTHLAERRTRDLLGTASELLEELTDGQLGFAERFQIASRATQTVRDPKTLSGGETFLASLALALAMVEIYSHRGPRLGALFLDEGFGALDTASLETALAVLRKQVGEDRLLVVISHLRPVAEAVQQVLLTEKTGSNSTARWLSGPQLGRFLYEEDEGGLLTPH
jgi:exonuclease SbcC